VELATKSINDTGISFR